MQQGSRMCGLDRVTDVLVDVLEMAGLVAAEVEGADEAEWVVVLSI